MLYMFVNTTRKDNYYWVQTNQSPIIINSK